MYRQRKRDLNLKPNRPMDKRSNRGMIYENEELRMRTIAICDDVDKGQSDIKKLRKENDHLKREIWGLRDECDKLEVMLKRVCISANIPEIQLEPSSKSCDEDEDDDDDDDPDFIDDDDNEGEGGGGGNPIDKKKQKKHLEPSSSLNIRDRRESGTSVMTFDSDVGSYMESMFSGEGLVQMEQQVTSPDGDLTCFASDDPGSVIMNPEVMSVEQPGKSGSEPIASTSAHHHPTYTHAAPWGHQTALAPDLEVVREESESTMNSPVSPSPNIPMSIPTPRIPLATGEQIDFDEETLLPDPHFITLPTQSSVDTFDPPEGRKTPVIQITPVGSPIEDLQQNPTSSELLGKLMNDQNNDTTDRENVQSFGCVAVVPKTFKVTSEIEVSEENNGTAGGTGTGSSPPPNIPPPMSPLRKAIKRRKEDASSNLAIADDEILFGHGPRRSTHFPGAPPVAASTMPQMSSFSNHHHRSSGYLGYCCCNNEQLLLGGYNSEPSLNFEQPLQSSALCCGPNAVTSPLTVRSVWNTVDKNIIIGFYKSFHEGATSLPSEAPKVQEIIDEVEKEFDPTLEKILGVRLIPGRIFISLRNASIVKSFLAHFKNGLLLMQQKTRIHFIEGATTKLTSRLVLSGIPQELSDLAVISALNQFGQVVAPLERRNYKGIDISERIAKMHLVIGETNVPDYIVISGYEVRIRVEQDHNHHESDASSKEAEQQIINKRLSMTMAEAEADGGKGAPRRKYGFVLIPPTPPLNPSTAAGSGSILKPHKPIQRSTSSAPRLETQTQLGCSLPLAEQQKRTNSVCVGNISQDQHPSKVLDNHAKNVTVTPQSQHHLQPKIFVVSTTSQPPGSCSTPNLQPSPKKPLARLMVSSPGSFPVPPSPVSSPGSPEGQPAGLKGFYKNFDPRRASTSVFDARAHSQLSQQSSYSPRGTRRKTSVQFADQTKKNSLPWFGCCSWI